MPMPQAPAVRRFRQLFGVIAIATGIQLIGAAQANTGGVPAMYATKAEAEAAAKKHFNCTGAHQMGSQWMPCATHGQSTGTTQHTH
jgi:hypothetical protein